MEFYPFSEVVLVMDNFRNHQFRGQLYSAVTQEWVVLCLKLCSSNIIAYIGVPIAYSWLLYKLYVICLENINYILLIKRDIFWCGLTFIHIRVKYLLKQLTKKHAQMHHWRSLVYSDDTNLESDSNDERRTRTPILIFLSSV